MVFDTNVVVSALLFGHRLGWLRQAWASGKVVPVVCRETVTELLRVLRYPKFRLKPEDIELLLGEYLPYADNFPLPAALPNLPVSCRDRADTVFLHLLLASGADLLVSGDEDLRMLADEYPIVAPATLQDTLQARC